METAAAQFGSVAEAAGMLELVMGYLAGADFPHLANAEMSGALRALERADAVEAVVRGKLIKMFGLSGGPAADAHQGIGPGWGGKRRSPGRRSRRTGSGPGRSMSTPRSSPR
jgi:hypothetical protein